MALTGDVFFNGDDTTPLIGEVFGDLAGVSAFLAGDATLGVSTFAGAFLAGVLAFLAGDAFLTGEEGFLAAARPRLGESTMFTKSTSKAGVLIFLVLLLTDFFAELMGVLSSVFKSDMSGVFMGVLGARLVAGVCSNFLRPLMSGVLSGVAPFGVFFGENIFFKPLMSGVLAVSA